ncbi:MAG: DUF2007 domain-containing protein [Bacteroidales bacterium]|nr:DUF2007 domain-containing protein [Bacteroidales bacterium]
MENDWVKIFDTPDELKIEIARQILDDNQIESVIINKKDRAYLFGELELYVNRDKVIVAKSVLKDFLS